MERIQVLVCAGTGCTIGNSGELIEAFRSEINSLGLQNEVSVLRTGCLGLCGVGPMYLFILIILFISLLKWKMLKKLSWSIFIKDVLFIV